MPWANSKSLTGRLLIASSLWVLLGLAAGGFLLSSAFQDHVETEMDARLRQILDSMVGVSDLDAEGNIFFTRPLNDQRFNEPYSGWYWQVSSNGRENFRSRSLWDQELAVNLGLGAFPDRIEQTNGPEDQEIRVLERDITLPGTNVPFRFMVAGDAAEMKAHIADFNQIVMWSLGALGFGILVALFLQVVYGLSPLKDVQKGLSDIREGNRKRLPRDCPPEIMPLVEEVNAVLKQNETLVERAKIQMGNLAHSLKTPLAVIANELPATKGSKFGKVVEGQTRIIRRQVDYQLARARAIGHSRHIKVKTDVEESIINVGRTIQRIYKEKDLSLKVEIEPGIAFQGERQDLEEILGNLLDNAAKWAKSQIFVTAKCRMRGGVPAFVVITIEDDGPGVSKSQRPSLYKRGKRLDEDVPGSGLGLAIVRDIAQIYGGESHLKRSKLGGLKVEVKLPAPGN